MAEESEPFFSPTSKEILLTKGVSKFALLSCIPHNVYVKKISGRINVGLKLLYCIISNAFVRYDSLLHMNV